MGRHKFRLSDMIPNAWFFKLRDMRGAVRGGGAASPGGASRAGRAGRAPSTPHRASYYYTPRAGDAVGSPLHPPRASDAQFPPLPLSPPRRSSKRRHRRRPVKLAPSLSGSSVVSSPVSTGCRCRRKPELVVVQAPGTPPCRLDKFVGYDNDGDSANSGEALKKPTVAVLGDGGLAGKLITSATDIIIDLRTKKRPDTDKVLLPPIVTRPKPARRTPEDLDLEDKHIDTLARAAQRTTTPFSDEQSKAAKPRRSVSSSARRLKTRGNTPRVASCKKSKPPAPSPAREKTPPLAESFAVVKTSRDPRRDFRESMEEMIAENGICTAADLEDLLACYLSLNAAEYHDLIVDVFEHIWAGLADISM
ncbi:unnamed protein product [Triticum turgidum subsp. durum]|uniref:Transcription repressor n=1 Tax=Triticum turgidum subsp. durum TaxID=4567 RepID=A0A9R1QPP9_TRITD|nr:unnamed protein product [Triticum turgidum subsp. durum]